MRLTYSKGLQDFSAPLRRNPWKRERHYHRRSLGDEIAEDQSLTD
ncbi:MAG: hypothetical protein ACFB0C_16715 [Leptolyngbyaceae cyanobacterium]